MMGCRRAQHGGAALTLMNDGNAQHRHDPCTPANHCLVSVAKLTRPPYDGGPIIRSSVMGAGSGCGYNLLTVNSNLRRLQHRTPASLHAHGRAARALLSPC
eukprot:GHVU01176899.1.p1 GENE.GHVU01176899.1~~GHVU01176899.1.p1  ORF type:complete len:101 (+),score=0.47 GHVU01176899.1:77-379(+)